MIIERYTQNGGILDTFRDTKEAAAALRQLKPDRTITPYTIQKACNGTLKSAYGFVWKYKDAYK